MYKGTNPCPIENPAGYMDTRVLERGEPLYLPYLLTNTYIDYYYCEWCLKVNQVNGSIQASDRSHYVLITAYVLQSHI